MARIKLELSERGLLKNLEVGGLVRNEEPEPPACAPEESMRFGIVAHVGDTHGCAARPWAPLELQRGTVINVLGRWFIELPRGPCLSLPVASNDQHHLACASIDEPGGGIDGHRQGNR